jgi:hypothetical protein
VYSLEECFFVRPRAIIFNFWTSSKVLTHLKNKTAKTETVSIPEGAKSGHVLASTHFLKAYGLLSNSRRHSNDTKKVPYKEPKILELPVNITVSAQCM